MSKKSNKENFIKKAIEIHGNKYDYSKVEYVNAHVPVIIICPNHGEFTQKPNTHLNGHGCLLCGVENSSNKKSLNKELFIKKSLLVHGNKYNYSNVEYKNSKTPVCIICPIHGEFWQIPSSHMKGCGCPKCKHNFKLTLKEFIKKANLIHNFKFDYSKSNYKNNSTKITIICPEHGEFNQTPNDHLSGCGCPSCNSSGYSRKEKESLGFIKNIYKGEIKENVKNIIEGKYELDIYLQELKIAFEFNGVHWHSIEFDENNTTKHLDKTKLCEEKGIKLFHIWESDWLENKSEVEDRIKKIFDTRIIEIPKDDIVEIDRSWPEFDKDEMQFCGYELIEEQEPNSFEYKDKYTLFDCGKLIYKKVE